MIWNLPECSNRASIWNVRSIALTLWFTDGKTSYPNSCSIRKAVISWGGCGLSSLELCNDGQSHRSVDTMITASDPPISSRGMRSGSTERYLIFVWMNYSPLRWIRIINDPKVLPLEGNQVLMVKSSWSSVTSSRQGHFIMRPGNCTRLVMKRIWKAIPQQHGRVFIIKRWVFNILTWRTVEYTFVSCGRFVA